MGKANHRSRGFTLIAALLLLLLLSGVAVGLMYLVTGQGHVGSNDLEANEAYYGAESGMEKLTADLAALYQLNQAPTPGQITALGNNPPTSAMVNGMNYQENITWQSDPNTGLPVTYNTVISSGVNKDLAAEIIPYTLSVTANRPGGASVNMTRRVEVALIPVFQFGVFCDGDCSYFAGPQFDFAGRVHTNGNLFLAANPGPLILDAKTTAVGEIVRDRLANGNTGGYTGDVYVPNANGGCDPPNATSKSTCQKFTMASASCGGALPPSPPCLPNGSWSNISTQTFNGMIGNASSLGVTKLQLPFVAGGADPIEIIRKGQVGDSAALAASREYNKANIRVLLADSLADLHPDRGAAALDAEDVDLTAGGPGPSPRGKAVVVTGVGTTHFAMANTTTANEAFWRRPNGVAADPWNLVKGYLRVEYRDNAGNWNGITNQWLARGFARGLAVPTAPGANAVHPNAILIFQQLADRKATPGPPITWGTLTALDAPSFTVDGGGNFSDLSWYPINFYDPREGFPRDTALAGTQCYANGIMNAVELDVGNLKAWLAANGANIAYAPTNGFLLYFSDRRGEVKDPNLVPPATTGKYGFEDVINSPNVATGMPNGLPEPLAPNGFSPEDVDENNRFDNWGSEGNGSNNTPVGVVDGFVGFGLNRNANPPNPYQALDCLNGGRQNIVLGARHVLKLVDGGLNRLPVRLDNNLGGFTVASENPVYVQGNYNSDSTDPYWGAANRSTVADIPHAAAAVIADAVTLLSSNWSDFNSMANPNTRANRVGNTTYYRMAVAGGKNMNFPGNAAWAADFGTDGGVHNFLRYIESWGGTLSYRGSLVSLYYSEYATGVYKCCTTVYNPPTRDYSFDSSFLNPSNLPPGTPMFQDIVNLSYWQNFSPY